MGGVTGGRGQNGRLLWNLMKCVVMRWNSVLIFQRLPSRIVIQRNTKAQKNTRTNTHTGWFKSKWPVNDNIYLEITYNYS